MKENYGERNQAEYDREEIAKAFAKLIKAYGQYGENLKLDSAGRVLSTSRNGDSASAYLPTFLETPDGEDPSIEDVYRVLKYLGEALVDCEISVNEDRNKGILEYLITSKRSTTGPSAQK